MIMTILGAILGWVVGGMLIDKDYWRAFAVSGIWVLSIILK